MRFVPGALVRFTCVLVAMWMIFGLASSAAGEINFEEVTVNLGPEEIHAELMDHRIAGSESQQLRAFIDDQHGNEDGEVVQDEVDDFTESEKEDLNEQLRFGGAFFFEPFKVNGRQAVTQEVTDIRLSETVLGTAQSDDTVSQDVEARLTFPSTEKTRVDVSFDEDFSVPFSQVDMRWGVAVFKTNDPWAIDPSTISPGGDANPYFEDGTFRVPYEESGNFSSQDEPLTFQIVDTREEEIKDESEGSPAPGVVLLLATVTGLVAWTRRIRAA